MNTKRLIMRLTSLLLTLVLVIGMLPAQSVAGAETGSADLNKTEADTSDLETPQEAALEEDKEQDIWETEESGEETQPVEEAEAEPAEEAEAEQAEEAPTAAASSEPMFGQTRSNIEESLVDDQAYLSKLNVDMIKDGTGVWDSDDNPGNDSNADNRIVRTFDTVDYTLSFTSNLQNQTTTTYFKTGYLYVRFELPCTMAEAKFDIDSMTWLVDGEQKEENGKVVLTGKRYITSDSGTAIPGEGTLSVVVKVLGMKNGDTLEPTFTAWMQGNDESEEKSATADPVTISAAPSYNIQLKRNGQMSVKDTFDFTTGISGAENQSYGQVTGRMYGYGVTIQLMNANKDKKFKGIELPKGQITFDLELKVEKGTTDITGTGSGQILPLLWDYKANNTATTGNLGRTMFLNNVETAKYAAVAAPFNTGTTYNSCTNGGSWSATQTGSAISVTVDAYKFLTAQGEYWWPTHRSGNSDTSATIVYGENKGIGCFSAGYFQILCPFPATVDDSASYYLTVSDTNMQAMSLSDVPVTNTDQADTTDDASREQVVISSPGSYNKNNYTTKASQANRPASINLSSSTTDQAGDAWTTAGSTIEIWGSFTNSTTNDLDQYPYAVNILQKFDDEAFQPLDDADGTPTSMYRTGTMQYSLLYAAKPGGTSWDDDTEMNLAEEEDLEYFATMADLKATYPNGVCVAVLIEGRDGIASADNNYIGFNVKMADTLKPGTIYQTTNTVRIWTQTNGSQMTVADSRLSTVPTVLAKLSTQDVLLDGTGAYSTKYGPYVKTEYDGSSQVKSGTHAPRGCQSGASILIVGIQAEISKSVDQVSSTSTGSTKVNYDVGVGQRRVDYVLTPSVKLANGSDGTAAQTTTVTITDTLPKGITVTVGTKYYLGGTYTADSTTYGGSLSGGTEITPAAGYPKENADGTTTIQWIIKDVVPGEPMEQIHFSANIGTPSDNTTDVNTGDQLTNTVQIQAEGDGRSINATNGNLATYTISITKLTQSALIKAVQTPLVEMGEDIVYQITHSSSSTSDYPSYSLLDILPDNDDGRGTDFDGSYTAKVTIDLSSSTNAATQMEIAVASIDQTGKTANTADASEFTVQDSVTSGNSITVTLPQGSTAFLVTGVLGAKDEVKVTVTLEPKGNSGGNTYCNDATAAVDSVDYILAPVVTATVVKRTIKGTVWHDTDKDGQYAAGEKLLAGVKVTLIDEATNTVAKDILGNEVDSVLTDADGNYSFTNLAKGSYTVRFESSSDFSIKSFAVTQKDVGDDTTDSDADGTYDTDGSLLKAEISQIALPDISTISAFGYTSADNDAGLTGGTPAALKLEGTKNLSGAGKDNTDISAGQFEFTITPDSENDTSGYSGLPTGNVEVAKGGAIDFGSITFTKEGVYKFEIAEVAGQTGGYTYDAKPVTVIVTVAANGSTLALETVVAYQKDGATADGITFTNTYSTEDTTAALSGQKILEGKDLEADMFRFILKDSNGDEVETVTNLVDGTFAFSDLTLDEAGTYIYTVAEVNDGLGGVAYDSTVYTVEIVVKDDGAGKLYVDEITYTTDAGSRVDDIEFTNTYTPASTAVKLEGTKTLNGKTLTEDAYSFVMTDEEGNTVAGATSKADGTITFSDIVFSETGIYTYTVSEVNGGLGGITYDDTSYTVTVTVTDDGEGQLVAEVTSEKDGTEADITFTNTYLTESTTVSLAATKKLTGKTLEENMFSFVVKDEAGNTVATAANKADGTIAFGEIGFTKTGNYKYTVSEVGGSLDGIIYDGTVHNITVKVTDNGDGMLNAEVVYEDGEIVFTNTYDEKPLLVTKAVDKGSIKEGEEIVYTIRVENTGNATLTGIRIRDYIPEYTTFVSADNNGKFGVINKKEHVTWFIEELKGGEVLNLTFKVKADACIPVSQIKNTALYEVTGKNVGSDTNYEKDPKNQTNQVITTVKNQSQTTLSGKNQSRTVSSIKTGDDMGNIILLCFALLIAAGCVIWYIYRKKHIKRG